MRYSFHGKVRATGQQVDGYVEAETSTEAIDRLADQGIIGVYSVRAEPKAPRNPVLLAGTPEFDRAQFESPDSPRPKRKALPAPSQYLAPVPLPQPQPDPVVPSVALPVAAPAASVSDAVMGQLVDKLSVLIGQMQKFLDRPAQVIYQSGGPAREGGGKGGAKRASRNVSDAQNSTLKDIFQNNLDLRRSLQKLADTVTPTAGEPPATNGTAVAAVPEPTLPAAAPSEFAPVNLNGFDDEPTPPPAGGAPADFQASAEPDPTGSAESHVEDSGHDLAMHVHDGDRARQAQPAA